MLKLDTITMKELAKIAHHRHLHETLSFILELLETEMDPKEFAKFLPEVGQG